MGKISVVLISALLAVSITNIEGNAIRDTSLDTNPVVCYFGSWAYYHKVDSFDIDNIKEALDYCTHINYGFAKINETTYEIQVFDENFDIQKLGYQRFVDLKQINPKLTTMISLGGWNEGSEKYSDMVTNTDMRHKFVESVVKFLAKYKFDGLDLDWEYPANRGGAATDKENYIKLLQELRDAFKKEAKNWLLTAALSGGKGTIDQAYGDYISKLNDLLDWGNLMTYDYHGGFDDYLGHNAPLYSRPEETEELEKKLNVNYRQFNVNYTVHYYLQNGLKREKMVMGVPFYGRAWSTVSPKQVNLHDLAKGMSPEGFISGEAGVLGYNEICQLELKEPTKWINTYDYYYKAPFAYNDLIFVGFDNIESLQCKLAFLKSLNLRGAMVWSLEFDDFNGHCGDGKHFPLLRKVHAMVNGDEKQETDCPIGGLVPTPTPTPTTTPTAPPTQQTTTQTGGHTTSSIDYWCSKDGYMPHPSDPHQYFQCEWIPGQGWYIHLKQCPGMTKWIQADKKCDG